MGPFMRRMLVLSLFAAFPLTAHAQSGRLTLEQHNPLPTAPDTSTETSTTVWWEPYNGASLTILDASGQPHSYQPGELSVPIAAYVAGNTLGVYIFLNSANVPVLGVSLWSSPTQETVLSVWQEGVKVNSASITLTTSSGSKTVVGASQATRVGVVYLPVDHETGIQPKLPPQAGGTSPTIGYCNDYNREPLSVIEQDATPTWQVQNWPAFQMVDKSAQNRIWFVSCDEGIQHEVQARTSVAAANSNNSLYVGYTMQIALDSDCTIATQILPGQVVDFGAVSSQAVPVGVFATVKGLQGLHYVQACESGNDSSGSSPIRPPAIPAPTGSGNDGQIPGSGNYGLILKTRF